jgi:hypothetical protein
MGDKNKTKKGKSIEPAEVGNRDQLKIGAVVLAKIMYVNPENNLCKVKTMYPSQDVNNCIWLTKSFTAPILGYKIKSMPSEGTYVYMLYGNPSFILGVVASPSADELFSEVLTADGQYTRMEYFEGELYKGAEVNASTLEGEFEIENAFNVGMSFLANIVALKAGERAKVETHLLNDMVRIIAEKFQVVTPLGTTTAYNNGRPNMEINFGSYKDELLNRAPNSQQAGGNPDGYGGIPLPGSEEDPVYSFGHRFRAYVGYLGNFINMFVSDPLSNINQISSGKAQLYVGNAGEVLIRSVSEIALERVVRIVTPVRVKDFLLNELKEDTSEENLKKWNYGGNESIHNCAYSLRCYARYLSNFLSLMRFYQTKDEDGNIPFKILKENELLIPDMNNLEKDLADQNNAVVFKETYSTIRIMRDGSIITMSSDGSCIYQGRGIIDISAPKDIRIEAARDLSIIVGRNTFIKSKKDVEISSVEGQLALKSREDLNMLTEEGRLWIKSDAPVDKIDPAIILDSSRNNILVNSFKETILRQEEGDFIVDVKKGNFVANVSNFLGLVSRRGDVFIRANKEVCLKARRLFLDSRLINLGNRITASARGLVIGLTTTIKRSLLVRRTIFGRPIGPKQFALYRDKNDSLKKGPIPGKYNHIRQLPGDDVTVLDEGDSGALLKSINKTRKHLEKRDKSFSALKWKFSDYDIDLPEDGSKESLFIPLAQDYIETHPDFFDGYIKWDFAEDKLKPAPRTDPASAPYPGKKEISEFYCDFGIGEVLDKPSNKDPKQWEQAQMKSRPITRLIQP